METIASESEIGEMDRISELPESIIHHILSFFNTLHDSPAELVRMSVLSKTWFHLTPSFPILLFFNDSFRSREFFFKYVDYTTSKFCCQNITAHKFKLTAILQEPAELDIVNKCLELVLKNGVRELHIRIKNRLESFHTKYRLPDILLSVTVLKSLTIYGCELPSSLMVDVVMFKSLIHLNLYKVPVDDEMIKYLTTSFPLLQILNISRCHGFKSFCVYGHQHLQRLQLQHNSQLERIDIEALNLSCLVLEDDETKAPQMNVASCKKLTTVTYFGHAFPNTNGFTDLLSNFPLIENLVLLTLYEGSSLNLSSHSLRTLVLNSNFDLKDIELRTHNLTSFGYFRNNQSLFSLLCDSVQLQERYSTRLKACMECYLDKNIDPLWFLELRLFLGKENGFKALNLHIHTVYSQNMIELEKLKMIEMPPYELEHIELELDACEESSAHIAFVDVVLWCCRPRSLTLKSSFPFTDYEELSDLVKFTCKKLLEQEEQGHAEIQIAWPSSLEAQKRYLKEFTREGSKISFIKKEGTISNELHVTCIPDC